MQNLFRRQSAAPVQEMAWQAQGETISLRGPAGVVRRLADFYAPHYRPGSGAAGATIRLTGELLPRAVDRQAQANPGLFLAPPVRLPGTNTYVRPSLDLSVRVAPDLRGIEIGSPVEEELELQLRVLVRDQLLTPLALRAGQVLVHASAVEREGGIVAFLGDKGAGKTTAMLELMATRGSNLVAADRLLLGAAVQGGPVIAAGLPERCNIDLRGFDTVPLLRRLQARARRQDAFNGKVLVDAKQLAAAAGVRVTARGPLAHVVFPRVSDATSLTVRPVVGEELAARLQANLLEGSEHDRYPNWLQLVAPPDLTPSGRLQALLGSLLSQVRGIEVCGPYDAYRRWLAGGGLDTALATTAAGPTEGRFAARA